MVRGYLSRARLDLVLVTGRWGEVVGELGTEEPWLVPTPGPLPAEDDPPPQSSSTPGRSAGKAKREDSNTRSLPPISSPACRRQ